jgi:hypothetical protein
VAAADTPADVLEMVRAHRGMMWLFLAKVGLDFGAPATRDLVGDPQGMTYWLIMAYWMVYMGVSLAVAYFVFRLARVTYGAGPATICAVLVFIACFGTIIVLVLSGNTMDRLRKSGVKVGFFGATARQIEELENPSKSPPASEEELPR